MYNAHLDVVHSVLNKVEEAPVDKGKGKAVDKGKGKAVDKGKGKAVENGNGDAHGNGSNGEAANGSVAPSTAPFRQLQPEEGPVTSAVRAAFSERVSLTREPADMQMETIISSTAPQQAEEEQVEHTKLTTPVIEERHLRESLMNTRPSVAAAERARFARIYQAFVSDRDGTQQNGDLGRATGTRTSLQ